MAWLSQDILDTLPGIFENKSIIAMEYGNGAWFAEENRKTEELVELSDTQNIRN